MASYEEVQIQRLLQRVAALEAQLRELTEGGPSDQWGSKQRPSSGIFIRDISIRGKVARLSYDSVTPGSQWDEV